MTKPDDGGPVHHQMDAAGKFYYGISLRDHFAGLAMQGMASRQWSLGMDADRIASNAYQLADGMLRRRAA